MADDNSRDIDHRAKNAMRKNLAFKSGIELPRLSSRGAHGLIWFLGTERLYLVINNPDG